MDYLTKIRGENRKFGVTSRIFNIPLFLILCFLFITSSILIIFIEEIYFLFLKYLNVFYNKDISLLILKFYLKITVLIAFTINLFRYYKYVRADESFKENPWPFLVYEFKYTLKIIIDLNLFIFLCFFYIIGFVLASLYFIFFISLISEYFNISNELNIPNFWKLINYFEFK